VPLTFGQCRSKLNSPCEYVSLIRVHAPSRPELANDFAQLAALTQLRVLPTIGGRAGPFPCISIVNLVVDSHSPAFIGGALGTWKNPASKSIVEPVNMNLKPITSPQTADATVYHATLTARKHHRPHKHDGTIMPMLLRRTLRSLPLLLLLHLPLAAQTTADQLPNATDPSSGPTQPPADVTRLHLIDNETILRMSKAGLGDDVLVQTIQLQPGHYDTGPDDLITLKQAGLSDRVIAAMQAHGTGLVIRGNPRERNAVQDAATVPTAPTPLTLGVDEIGVYYKSKTGEYIELHTERVVFKSGGAAKSILTHGIISKDMNGHLDGAQSDLILPTGVEILIYAPTGTDANEYDLLRFEQHKDNREFRTLTGGVFHSESGAARDEIEFHPKKIAAQLYSFTIPKDIEKGEYGVLPPGAANVQGIAGTGKIFTFSIRE